MTSHVAPSPTLSTFFKCFPDVATHIKSYLTCIEFWQLMRTCKEWLELGKKGVLWSKEIEILQLPKDSSLKKIQQSVESLLKTVKENPPIEAKSPVHHTFEQALWITKRGFNASCKLGHLGLGTMEQIQRYTNYFDKAGMKWCWETVAEVLIAKNEIEEVFTLINQRLAQLVQKDLVLIKLVAFYVDHNLLEKAFALLPSFIDKTSIIFMDSYKMIFIQALANTDRKIAGINKKLIIAEINQNFTIAETIIDMDHISCQDKQNFVFAIINAYLKHDFSDANKCLNKYQAVMNEISSEPEIYNLIELYVELRLFPKANDLANQFSGMTNNRSIQVYNDAVQKFSNLSKNFN